MGKAREIFPDLPLVIWLILITIFIGILSGNTPQELISQFNAGWGLAAGEFALILLPSFTLAAAIERMHVKAASGISVGMAPFAGAAMICPDTAYAALSPMVKYQRLSLAFGSYSGFKLLFPAGPLIVATSLGVADSALFGYCVAVFIPVWIAGMIFSRTIERSLFGERSPAQNQCGKNNSQLLRQLWPLALLAALLTAGLMFPDLSIIWLSFAFNPKGALLITAVAALCMVHHSARRNCLESGIQKTASLLLIICAASAFSIFFTAAFPVHELFSTHGGLVGLLSLFALGALLKLTQGSSMATFAAAGPMALPVVAASGLPPVLAVLAICLGSFIAILPNDSFYWLVRRSALPDHKEAAAVAILSGGALLQATIGLIVILTFYLLNIV